MRSAAWTPSDELKAELRPISSELSAPQTATDPEIAHVVALGAEGWYALENWAKQTGSLPAWQRTVAHDVGTRLAGGRTPSPRQAQQASQILKEAAGLGFQT